MNVVTLALECATEGCPNEGVEVLLTTVEGTEVHCGPCGAQMIAAS